MSEKMKEIEVHVKDSLIQANSLQITDQMVYEKAADLKILLSRFRKQIKGIYDPTVAIAKNAYDEIRGERDKHLKPVVGAEDILKRKIKDYEDKKAFEAEQKRKEAAMKARKEAEEEAKEFGVDVDEVEQEAPPPVHTIDKVLGLGIRKVWNVYVIDKSKVPLSFMEPNLVALRNQARLDKEKFKVEGCEAKYE